MTKNLLVYVAGAYSGSVTENIARAERVSIDLIRNGWHVITPHKNTSGYEKYENHNITKDTWLEMDINILARCDLMYVLDNWETSDGTKAEMVFASKHLIPIFMEEDHPAHGFFPTDMRQRR